MDEPKLTLTQIESLFDFCRKHYVEYYDLQVELVDHLASRIEEIWETQPDLSFQKALNKSFDEFGISGFSRIKAAKQKGLQKKYRRLIWDYLKEFFKLPKIILTVALTGIFYELLRLLPNQRILLFSYTGILVIFTIYYLYHIFPKYFKIKTPDNKKFLIISALNGIQAGFGMFPILGFQLSNSLITFDIQNFAWWGHLLLSALLSGITILMIAYFYYIPKKVKEDFTREFPQFVAN